MLIQNLSQIYPAFIGFLLTFSWLIYTSLKVGYKINLIQVLVNWFSSKKVLLPSLATLISPFVFMYLYEVIPGLVEKWKLREFVGILGAMTGVILGFLVSEFRQWKTERQQINTVRTMLMFEINQDVKILIELKNKLQGMVNTSLLIYVEETPVPLWNRAVWKSQTLLLPFALNEEELNHIFKFYNELDQIVENYSRVIELVSEFEKLNIELKQLPNSMKMKIGDEQKQIHINKRKEVQNFEMKLSKKKNDLVIKINKIINECKSTLFLN